MASSKPIQEQIYKSRLTITYRTTITGTPQEESLPFRLLVLGPFAGNWVREIKLLPELANRQVRTIKRGRSVNDHLGEVLPIWRIKPASGADTGSRELKALESKIPGKVKIQHISVMVPANLTANDEKQLNIQGKAEFSSARRDNGFCEFESQKLDIQGTITVKGPSEDPKWSEATIAFRLHAMAKGDRLDPATGASSGKVVALADNVRLDVSPADYKAWSWSQPEEAGETLEKQKTPTAWRGTPSAASANEEYDVELERAVPFTSLDSWSPDKIVESIPEIERVQILKRLLGRLHSELRNRPELRAKFKDLLQEPAKFEGLSAWVAEALPALKMDISYSTLEKAKRKEKSAKLSFEAAKKAPDATVDSATQAYFDARKAYDEASRDAAKEPAAKQALDAAKTTYDKVVDDAKTAVTTAQATYDAESQAATPDATKVAAAKQALEKAKAAVDALTEGAKVVDAMAEISAAQKVAAAAMTQAKEQQDKLLKPIDATSNDLYVDSNAWAVVRRIDPTTDALKFDDRNPDITDAAWLMNGLAVLLANIDVTAEEMRRRSGEKPGTTTALAACFGSYTQFLHATSTLIGLLDEKSQKYLDAVYHNDNFQSLEATWRGLAELSSSVESEDVFIDFLDVAQQELMHDLVDHDLDMFSGALFNKVYVGEYDRYGGKPFAAMIGLFEYNSSREHVDFLRAMGRVANASHCPFIAATAPNFFSPYKSIEEVAEISDLDAVLREPQFGKWQELRDTEYAAYIGLTLPRYLVREPWKQETMGNDIGYREKVPYSETANGDSEALKENLLWGNAAILFAKNMVASYQGSGWAQYLRGPRGGGLCEGLVSYKYTKNGYEEIQPPVEISIPDYRELQFANNGFIPLVHKKGEAVATFFSAQSLKKSKRFVENLSTQNAALVTNLAYTLSVTRIAHYVKRMMREYIGASADGPYIQKSLAAWLGQYVTIVANPDDLTLRYYPFKAATVDVQPKPGPLGWYKAVIKILPHVQFEGMDVELQLEAALGGP